MKKLSTEPYKGTRDFYPEDMRLQKYIFNTMRSVVEKSGYQECTASIIEETDLYRAKTGEEIVGEQTYSFTDRGGRDITLRPEMTPTVARMVANRRRELTLPVRWYSIPNCFRYERPQRGRLREFWQLNVDMLGVESIYGDTEIIRMAYDIMRAFGATQENFIIRINDRKLMNFLFADILKLNEENTYTLSKLIDKKAKVSEEEFSTSIESIAGENIEVLKKFLNAKSVGEIPEQLRSSGACEDITRVLDILNEQGITNCVFDPTLMRGFDYYTGVVFEVYDTNPLNSRSMFGGGRYDNLVDLFGVDSISAVGFGMGDVTMQDFLEVYNLIPNLNATRKLTICTLGESVALEATALALQLREEGIAVAVDYSDKKIGNKIKAAEEQGSEYVICFGEEEVEKNSYALKKLSDFSEEVITREELLCKW